MRIVAIVLFIATLVLIVAGLTSRSVQKTRLARERVKVMEHHVVMGHGPHQLPSAIQDAHHQVENAERDTKPFFDMQILLTAILLPFCLFLVFKRYHDAPTKTFAFSSLAAIIAFWFYVPPSA